MTERGSQPLRAGVYVRVSSKGQAADDKTSLDTQLAECRGYVRAQGWSLDERHVYREVFSGAYLDERPELTRLRADVARGELDRIVVYHSDRFGRDPEHRIFLRVEAGRSGCEWVSVKDPLAADDPYAGLVEFVKGLGAKDERSAFARRAQGAWPAASGWLAASHPSATAGLTTLTERGSRSNPASSRIRRPW